MNTNQYELHHQLSDLLEEFCMKNNLGSSFIAPFFAATLVTHLESQGIEEQIFDKILEDLRFAFQEIRKKSSNSCSN